MTPNVANIFIDPDNDITFKVMAYRKLSKQELIQAVNMHASRRAKPARGTTVTIFSVIR